MESSPKNFSSQETQREFLNLPKEEQDKETESAYGDARHIEEEAFWLTSNLIHESNGFGGRISKVAYNPNLPPEVVAIAAKKALIGSLLKGNAVSINDIIKTFKIPGETLMSQEVQEAALKGVLASVKNSEPQDCRNIIDTFKISYETLTSPEVQNAIIPSLILNTKYANIELCSYIVDTFNIARETLQSSEIQKAAKEAIIQTVSSGFLQRSIAEIITTFTLPDALVQEALKQGLVKTFSIGNLELLNKFVINYKPSSEILQSQEVQEAAKKLIITYINKGLDREALKIINNFIVSSEILQSQEVQEAAKNILQVSLLGGNFDVANAIIETYSLSEETIREVSVNVFKHHFTNPKGSVGIAIETALALKSTDEILLSPEIQELAKIGIIKCFSELRFSWSIRAAEVFKISDDVIMSEEVQSTLKDNIVQGLLRRKRVRGYSAETIEKIQEAVAIFNIPQDFVESATKEAIIAILPYEDLTRVLKIITTFNVSQEFVHLVVKDEIIKKISSGFLGNALEMAKTFNISLETLLSPELKEIINKCGYPVPIERILEIVKSDRFGSNLFCKFSSFDKTAKEAVSTIIKADETIPSILDRRSLEYRQQVQERLRGYKNNEQTLQTLQEKGIHTDAWLNHDSVDYFNLGKSDELSFSQKIKQPVKRLPESVSMYAKSILGAIEEYQPELEEKKVTEDIAPLEQELAKMKTLLANADEEKKKQGITRGIASLEARIDDPKEVKVWVKLRSEITKLNQLALEVNKTNEALIAEASVKVEVVDDVSLAQSLTQKKKVWSIQKKLISDLTKLKLRLDEVFDVYTKTLTQAIGKDRAEGVVGQMKGEIGEFQDHIQTDFDTIFSFMNETPSHEEVVTDVEVEDDSLYKPDPQTALSLEGRSMSIRVGSRSRQDLYLGNFTACCIRIDSDHHQDESPIGDYLTDLGMQNVILYDETTKTPVACAWCWLGTNTESGQTALVIDNVEGWQKYTVNFQTQLEQQMLAYLEDYRQKIGADILVQGPSYNDLNIVAPENQKKIYEKIGECNRYDGYYLEAEYDEEDLEQWDENDFHEDD